MVSSSPLYCTQCGLIEFESKELCSAYQCEEKGTEDYLNKKWCENHFGKLIERQAQEQGEGSDV